MTTTTTPTPTTLAGLVEFLADCGDTVEAQYQISAFAAVSEENAHKLEALAAYAEQPAEPFPAPEGFQGEIVIGHVHGEPVIGIQEWCSIGGRAHRHSVRVHLNGLHLDCEREHVCALNASAPFAASLPVADALRLGEVAASGALAELHALALSWCDAD